LKAWNVSNCRSATLLRSTFFYGVDSNEVKTSLPPPLKVKQATVHDKAVKQRTFSLPFLITLPLLRRNANNNVRHVFFFFLIIQRSNRLQSVSWRSMFTSRHSTCQQSCLVICMRGRSFVSEVHDVRIGARFSVCRCCRADAFFVRVKTTPPFLT
jgi:hypothetical protein